MSSTTGIAVDEWWAPLEPCSLCRASKGGSGDDYADRVTARASALQACARGINHVGMTSVRLAFNCTQPYAYLPAGAGAGQVDIYRYLVRDFMMNERARVAHILHQMRTADPGTTTSAYAQFLDGTLSLVANERTSRYEGSYASSSLRAAGPHVVPHYVGVVPDAEKDEGLAVFNNYCPISTVVQTDTAQIGDGGGWLVASDPPRAGEDVLAGYLEHLRATFHTLRTRYERNVLMWYAAQDLPGWLGVLSKNMAMTADSGNEHGIHVTATDYHNVLDQASTTRTATSPGWSSHVYACGRGDMGTTAGTQLKVVCRVLAAATTADATVRFIGPDSFASNNSDITITADAAVAWYGDNEDTIYLDTSSTNTDETTARNKIDVHAKAGEDGALYIYGLQCWAVWS